MRAPAPSVFGEARRRRQPRSACWYRSRRCARRLLRSPRPRPQPHQPRRRGHSFLRSVSAKMKVGYGSLPKLGMSGSGQSTALAAVNLEHDTGVRKQDTGHDDQVAGFVHHVNRVAHGGLMTGGQARVEVRRDELLVVDGSGFPVRRHGYTGATLRRGQLRSGRSGLPPACHWRPETFARSLSRRFAHDEQARLGIGSEARKARLLPAPFKGNQSRRPEREAVPKPRRKFQRFEVGTQLGGPMRTSAVGAALRTGCTRWVTCKRVPA